MAIRDSIQAFYELAGLLDHAGLRNFFLFFQKLDRLLARATSCCGRCGRADPGEIAFAASNPETFQGVRE
jgi:hypothetical protein